MKPINLYQTFIFTLIFNCLIGSTIAVSQVTVAFEKTSYNAATGSKLQANLVVTNLTYSSVRFILSVKSSLIPIIGNASSHIELQANDSMIIPIQLYIPKKIIAESPNILSAQLIIEENNKILADSSVIIIAAEKNIYLQVPTPEVFLHNNNSPIEFKLRVVNDGNTGQVVRVHSRNGLTGLLNDPFATFYLSAYKDTTLLVRTHLNSSNSSQENPTIALAATYEDNSVFSQAFVRVRNVAGVKVYKQGDVLHNSGGNNKIGLYARFMGTPLHYYELMSNVTFNTAQATITYGGNLSYFPASTGVNKTVLSNTLFDLQKQNWGFQAGNVYHSDEVSIAGRGLSFNVKMGNGGKLTTGYINSTYNLLAINNKKGMLKPANLAYITYASTDNKSIQLTASIKRLWDPQSGINGMLGGGMVKLRSKSNVNELVIGGHGSYARNDIFNGKSSIGASGTISYTGSFNRWQVSSSNYVSSKNYIGISRGSIQLDERISFNTNKGNIWARFNKSENNPTIFIANYPIVENEYGTTIAELGFQQPLGKALSYSIKPYFYNENSFSTYTSINNNIDLKATRLSLSLNTINQSSQSISVNADIGYFLKAPYVYKNTMSYRVNALYRYKWFNLNALWQNGPYYASEMRMYYYSERIYKMLLVGPGLTKSFFRDKLSITFTDMLAYENTFNRLTNNIGFVGSLKFAGTYKLEARLNKQQYGFIQGLTTVDIGIVKHFSPKRSTAGVGSLHALFFEDLNGNNQLDAGEKGLPNIYIKINDELFMTGTEGEIIYRSVPNGSYQIDIYQSKGLVANARKIIVKGKTTLQIPLHQLEVITGQLVLKQQDRSFENDGNISGISIKAFNSQGQMFTAITNEEGRFIIYAPANEYTLQLSQESMSDVYECEHPTQKITLERTKSLDVTFELMVKKRQVKIIKFASN